jgi:hypothetical protein
MYNDDNDVNDVIDIMNNKMTEIKQLISALNNQQKGIIHILLVDEFKKLCKNDNNNNNNFNVNQSDENKDKDIVLNRCGKIWESFHKNLYEPIWGDYNFHTKNFAFKDDEYKAKR